MAVFDVEGPLLLPAPRRVTRRAVGSPLHRRIVLTIADAATAADRFTADDLAARLGVLGFRVVDDGGEAPALHISLTRQAPDLSAELGREGYRLTIDRTGMTIAALGEPGLFYGTRTLLQLLRLAEVGDPLPGLEIVDWPDIPYRAVHYDTKHHQDGPDYVRAFIRRLADLKINMLVWEWEDKFAYRSHPEIGAPGAFTMAEMQAFTRYARQYHIQLVPLVQGLGHASYILKWPQYAHLREIPASNWEFCPLSDGTYELLGDLWAEAVEATPGSDFIHIGTDETYELGLGEACGCRARAAEIGTRGLLLHFIRRAAEALAPSGRRIICWGGEYRPDANTQPPEGLIVAEFTDDLDLAKASRDAGYPAWVYDPNPGIEHLFLPYLVRYRKGEPVESCLQASRKRLTTAATSGFFEGMISTSWDDSGLHNQIWMMRFAGAAAYAWNGRAPGPATLVDRYLTLTYGPQATAMRELWRLLNEGAYFYMDSFERKVWHWGEVGKTHLPDLPRGDAVEFDPYWQREYAAMIARARDQRDGMARAIEICRANLARQVDNRYDFELFTALARLIDHTAATYLALASLEDAITRAHQAHFVDHAETYAALNDAIAIVEANLAERDDVFIDLLAVWEETTLSKGLWTEAASYFHQQDRARHFANRRPDMTYLIYDEQLLDLEGYLAVLKTYTARYAATHAL
jgi:hexosaminidase